MRFTLFIFFIFSALASSAQWKKFYVAAYGGANYGKLRGTDLAVQNLQYGMSRSAGISLQYALWGALTLQTDLSFDRKNTGFKGSDNYDVATSFNYYSAHLFLGQEIYYGTRANRISFNVGMFYNQLKEASRIYTNQQKPKTEMDVTTLYLKKDYGLSFGVIPKFFFANNRFAIQFEMRYDLGFKNINNYPVFKQGTIRTNYFYLLVGAGYCF